MPSLKAKLAAVKPSGKNLGDEELNNPDAHRFRLPPSQLDDYG